MKTRSTFPLALSLAVFMVAMNLGGAMAADAQTKVQPPLGMVSWWPGDGDARDIVADNHGMIHNGVTMLPGMVGLAFNFVGNNGIVQIPHSESLNIGGSYTYELWFCSLFSENKVVMEKGWNKLFLIQPWAGGLHFGHHRFAANTPIYDGQFHHLAVIYDVSTLVLSLYIDGSHFYSAYSVPAPTPNSDPLVFGNRYGTPPELVPFRGLVDEVTIYDRALIPQEIKAIFDARSAGKSKDSYLQPMQPPQSVLWLPFDETFGTTAEDISGAGRVGTLTGGASFIQPGFVAGALDLSSGNGEVRVTPVDGLNYQDWQVQTIDFWIKWGGPRDVGLRRQYIWDMQEDNFGATSPFAVVVIDEANSATGPGLKAVGRGSAGEVRAVAPLPNVGVWEHYGCVFDKLSSVIKIFKNGVLASSVPWTPFGNPAPATIRIGNFNPLLAGSHDWHFQGCLDEFTVSNADLSAVIPDIYRAGNAGKYKGDMTPPVANAGPDQATTQGKTVALDGSNSEDNVTASAALQYTWSFVSRPAGSITTLDNAHTATPSFYVDQQGDYKVQLVVRDEAGNDSDADVVMISSSNLAPTAEAGSDMVVVTNIPVLLDGQDSSDPELMPLSYLWTIVSKPSGSNPVLIHSTLSTPLFTADLPGVYTVQLVVSDGFLSSQPDIVTLMATTGISLAEDKIREASDLVKGLARGDFDAPGHRNYFTNMFAKIIDFLQKSNLSQAKKHLQKVISRTDGCALRNAPDPKGKNKEHAADFIVNCVAQQQVYSLLTAALALIN